MRYEVILDTNVFVAAVFNPESASARILHRVRRGELRMVWNEPVRRETERIIHRIPRLSWEQAVDLFREQDRFDGATEPERFDFVPDPDDRKLAALAEATGAVLVTSDSDLLHFRERIGAPVLTPGEFRAQFPES